MKSLNHQGGPIEEVFDKLHELRVVLFVAASAHDRIGNFYTDWYSWPDWRGSGECAYPGTYLEPGGEPATCSRHMQDDAGTDVVAHWEVRTPDPTKFIWQ